MSTTTITPTILESPQLPVLKHHLKSLKKTAIPATFVSFRRSQRRIKHSSVILSLNTKVDSRIKAENFVGNAVEFFTIYRNKQNEECYRKVEGVISRVHGNSGKVIAVMEVNLCPNDIGKSVYVKFYKK